MVGTHICWATHREPNWVNTHPQRSDPQNGRYPHPLGDPWRAELGQHPPTEIRPTEMVGTNTCWVTHGEPNWVNTHPQRSDPQNGRYSTPAGRPTESRTGSTPTHRDQTHRMVGTHTRWATHGEPNWVNTHPQRSDPQNGRYPHPLGDPQRAQLGQYPPTEIRPTEW